MTVIPHKSTRPERQPREHETLSRWAFRRYREQRKRSRQMRDRVYSQNAPLERTLAWGIVYGVSDPRCCSRGSAGYRIPALWIRGESEFLMLGDELRADEDRHVEAEAPMEIASADPKEIVVGKRLRPLDPAAVNLLKDSISKIGLQTPLSVRPLSNEGGLLLVAGHYRLQACIELGMTNIPVRVVNGSEIDARLWEIAENLHRAELTLIEKAEHIAEWIRLVEERGKVSAQVAPKLSVRGRVNEGRPKSGINAAARELGVERTEAQRAIKIASLDSEAKAEAKALKLDDNQSSLLKAARQSGKEGQIRVLQEHAVKKAAPRTPDPSADTPADDLPTDLDTTPSATLTPEIAGTIDDNVASFKHATKLLARQTLRVSERIDLVRFVMDEFQLEDRDMIPASLLMVPALPTPTSITKPTGCTRRNGECYLKCIGQDVCLYASTGISVGIIEADSAPRGAAYCPPGSAD